MIWTLYLLFILSSGEYRTVPLDVDAGTELGCLRLAIPLAPQHSRDGEKLKSWACIEGVPT